METPEYARTFTLENRHWWFVGLHELIVGFLPGEPGGSLRILDAGCGTGGLLEKMLPYGECEGLDASEVALELCRKRRGLENVRRVDLNEWQAPSEAYDAITCVDVLYHLNIRDEEPVVEKFRQALKQGGRLILQEPAFPLLFRAHDMRVMGRKRFRKTELVALLESKGFVVRRATYRLPLLFLFIAVGKLLRLIAERDQTSDLDLPPGWLNALGLVGVRIENRLIRWGLPLYPGSSTFVVADKT